MQKRARRARKVQRNASEKRLLLSLHSTNLSIDQLVRNGFTKHRGTINQQDVEHFTTKKQQRWSVDYVANANTKEITAVSSAMNLPDNLFRYVTWKNFHDLRIQKWTLSILCQLIESCELQIKNDAGFQALKLVQDDRVVNRRLEMIFKGRPDDANLAKEIAKYAKRLTEHNLFRKAWRTFIDSRSDDDQFNLETFLALQIMERKNFIFKEIIKHCQKQDVAVGMVDIKLGRFIIERITSYDLNDRIEKKGDHFPTGYEGASQIFVNSIVTRRI